MNDSHSEWEKLIKASQPARQDIPTENAYIPGGIDGLRKAVHSMAIALTWRKLSLIALALAALLLAAMFLASGLEPESPTLIVPEAPNEIMSP